MSWLLTGILIPVAFYVGYTAHARLSKRRNAANLDAKHDPDDVKVTSNELASIASNELFLARRRTQEAVDRPGFEKAIKHAERAIALIRKALVP